MSIRPKIGRKVAVVGSFVGSKEPNKTPKFPRIGTVIDIEKRHH